MEANMKRTKIISIVFTILLSISCTCIYLDPIIRLHQLMPEVIFTLPGFNPRDQSPNYEISYVVLVISGAFGCTAVSVNNALFMTLIIHAKAEMEWIKQSLDLTDDSHLNSIYHYLKIKKIHRQLNKNMTKTEKADLKMFYIIQKHIGIMQYVKLVKNIYSTSLGGQFLALSLCLGTILIQVEASSVAFNAVVIMNIFGDLVFYCHFGESLMTSGENLIFHGWDQLPKKSRLSLILFDNAMKRTLNLDAGGIYTLSNKTLMFIIQRAYTFYNVFNNTNQQ